MTANSAGTTIRSWQSSTAKASWPSLVPKRCCVISSCMTMAVDEKLSAMPRIAAVPRPWPRPAARPPITAAVTSTWASPMPNTWRRSDQSRGKARSSPIMNRRKTTPSSPISSTRCSSVIVR
ncbi:MAG: hypothetical protein M5U07_16975 [Xanthobacteraceae bacterium]|nr:hypothetical protein [Xanthobacteraceae bacterium]